MIRVVHCKRERYTHYIGRPSVFGNPHRITKTVTRGEAIRRFETYARNSPEVAWAIYDLPADAVLGCWCDPDACHGDMIVKLWQEFHPEES